MDEGLAAIYVERIEEEIGVFHHMEDEEFDSHPGYAWKLAQIMADREELEGLRRPDWQRLERALNFLDSQEQPYRGHYGNLLVPLVVQWEDRPPVEKADVLRTVAKERPKAWWGVPSEGDLIELARRELGSGGE